MAHGSYQPRVERCRCCCLDEYASFSACYLIPITRSAYPSSVGWFDHQKKGPISATNTFAKTFLPFNTWRKHVHLLVQIGSLTSHLVVHFVHETSEQTQIYLARNRLALLIHQRVASMFRPAALSTLAPPLALLSTRRQEKRPSFLQKEGCPWMAGHKKKVKLMEISCLTIICFPSTVFCLDWWFTKWILLCFFWLGKPSHSHIGG